VWALDPSNSRVLIEGLRRHGRGGDFEVAWVGEGWRPLVESCHQRLVTQFPDYELLAVKQKFGVLAFQAFPRPSASDYRAWTDDEYAVVTTIIEQVRSASESVCEWCGAAGSLREWRTMLLTLCDACDQRFPDPPIQARR
jgi:hypothetical protein